MTVQLAICRNVTITLPRLSVRQNRLALFDSRVSEKAQDARTREMAFSGIGEPNATF